MTRDSVVGTTTGYGLHDRGIRVQVSVGSRIICYPRSPDRLWGPHNLQSNGYRRLFRRGHEADHSPPASAEVKKMWNYTFTHPYAFMA
jgi:hypothetical protein